MSVRLTSTSLWSLTTTLILSVVSIAKADQHKEVAVRPNVIIIYTDDQGFGDVSYLNPDAKFQTPALDRIAREGIAFTNAHSSDSVCTPSRYGLLTGRYCWRTTLKKGVMGAEGKCLIQDGQVTLASLLRQQGYRTGMVGKWHLGMDFPGSDPATRDWSKPVLDMPLDKGFDEFFGIPASLNYGVLAWFRGRHAAVPPRWFTNKKPNRRHVDYRIMPPYQSSPDETLDVIGKRGFEVAEDFVDNQCLTRFTDEAIAWIGRQQAEGTKPFFLYLPLTSPHYPVCPLPEFHGKGDCGGYGEFMIETDHHVGRVLDFLDQKKIADDTLIIVTSDNGPERSWVQRAKQYSHQSNHRYREGKRSVYEGGHRVPFLVRWSSGIANPGRQYDGLIGQVDLLATLAELVGADQSQDAGVDSHSFAHVLSNDMKSVDRPPLVNHSAQGRYAITRGNWKLILSHGKQPLELYDLASDPSEQNNIAGAHADRCRSMQATLTDIVCNGRTTPGPLQRNDTGYWSDLTWIDPDIYTSRQKGSLETK